MLRGQRARHAGGSRASARTGRRAPGETWFGDYHATNRRSCLLARAPRRVNAHMGERAARAEHAASVIARARSLDRRGPAVSTTLDGPQRAAWLIERREQLIEQLPRRIRRAGAFRSDVHELIVDEAIEFVAVRHDGELADGDELRALFWSACEVRVRRAREGRYDTGARRLAAGRAGGAGAPAGAGRGRSAGGDARARGARDARRRAAGADPARAGGHRRQAHEPERARRSATRRSPATWRCRSARCAPRSARSG